METFGEVLRAVEDRSSLECLLRRVRREALSGGTARRITRALDRWPAEIRLRIALAGTHTFDPLPDYVRVLHAQAELEAAVYVAPTGQHFQQLAVERSPLVDFEPNLVFVSASMRELAPRVVNEFASLGAAELVAERERIIGHLQDCAAAAGRSTHATVLICNFPRPSRMALGIADLKRPAGETEFYLELNLALLRAFRDDERACVLDLDRLVCEHGAANAFSDRMYYLAKQPWTRSFCAAVAEEIVRYAIAARGVTRKCLVVDLDNTVWGGAVGEDGAEGLRIGPGDPVGEAFLDVQQTLRSIRARGILLAAASRNNAEDVDEAFARRAEMPLRREEFSAFEVNWAPKVESLERVAHDLDIGTSSLVFIDDNPAERMQVAGALPEVRVVDLPPDVSEYARLLRALPWFERLRLTADDDARPRQYAEQASRAAHRRRVGSLESYLRDLGTEAVVRRAQRADLVRAHQLFSKTNQFNLTTTRYDLGQVEGFLDSPGHLLRVVGARDRFGDLGTIGLYLLEVSGDTVRIDSFLLSCRALGRGIETAVMNALKQDARRLAPGGALHACFRPTRKNAPAADFYGSQGLGPAAACDGGTRRYEIPIAALAPQPVPHVQLRREDPQ